MAVTAMAIQTLDGAVAAPQKPPPAPPTIQPFLPDPVLPVLASANTTHFQKTPPPVEKEKSMNSEMTEMTLWDSGNMSICFFGFDNTITKVKKPPRPLSLSLSLDISIFNCFFSVQLSYMKE
jgi:hypothetical protein